MAGTLATVALAVGITSAPTVAAGPYDPLEGNEGFLVFVQNDATLVNNESEGPIAVGGDLTIGGTYQVAFVTAGSYVADGESLASGLVVGGAVNWADSAAGATLFVNANANVNIGDLTGSFPRWTDDNGASVNTRVLPVPSDFNATPRVELRVRQDPPTVQWTNPIDFDATFATFRERSQEMADCTENVTLTVPGAGPVARPIPAGTGQLNVTITPGVANVLNLTGEELNNFGTLNFTDAPTADAPLVINVDTSATGGVFAWTGFNFAGSFNASHILFNFPDATQITLTGTAPTVEGTIYAPNAALIDDSPSNTEGNIVAMSYAQGTGGAGGGEVHNFPFSGTVNCTPATPTPTVTASPTPTTSPSPTPTTTPSPTPTTTPSPTPTTTPSPTPTTSPVPPPPTSEAPPAPPGAGGPLPVTGAPLATIVAAGLGLIASGFAVLIMYWRRRTRTA